MTKVDRRHFLMSSVALPVALKASALPSQNNTVRVAVVGFNGRGKAHISAYLKIPNVEIAALCDVDQAVVENAQLPPHAAVSYNMFEAQQIIAATALGVKYPTQISSMGGHYMFDDDQETPNTQVATFEFQDNGKKKLLVFEVRHWVSNNEAGIGERSDAQSGGAAGQPQTVGNIWYGSKGYMATSREGWKTFMGPEQAPGPKSEAGAGVGGFVNFIDVVRSRKREDQLAEIEEGAISTMLIHLANISHRTGRTLYFDPVTYSCKGDAEATAMFTRNQYRSSFVVPNVAGTKTD